MPQLEKDIRTQSLDLLRFPLAVIVVIEHVFNKESVIVSNGVYDVANISIYIDLLLFIEAFLRSISVPTFFFISGYVFFLGVGNYNFTVFKRKLKNRVFTLLIPYVIWNLLEMVIPVAKSILNGISSFSTYGTEVNFTLKNILSCFWKYNGELFVPISPTGERIIEASLMPLNAPLWFLRDLMVIVLLTPIIFKLIKHTKYWLIVALLIIYFSFNYSLPYGNALLFFSMGAYLSVHNKDMVVVFGKFFTSSMVIYPLFSLLTLIATKYDNAALAEIFKQISTLGFLLFVYNISIYVLKNTNFKPSKILPAASFFIYVSHILICARVTKVMFMLIRPNSGVETILVYILSTACTVLSLLTVYVVMKKLSPGLLRILTGRK
ncbi:MAG: acyltransferase [Alistipes sp.]|nr:acyltransferase [Alistipes sp.]